MKAAQAALTTRPERPDNEFRGNTASMFRGITTKAAEFLNEEFSPQCIRFSASISNML